MASARSSWRGEVVRVATAQADCDGFSACTASNDCTTCSARSTGAASSCEYSRQRAMSRSVVTPAAYGCGPRPAKSRSAACILQVRRAVVQHLHHEVVPLQGSDRAGDLVAIAAERTLVRHHEHVTGPEGAEQAAEPLLPGLGRLGGRVLEVEDRDAEGGEVVALLDHRRHVVAG